MTSVLEACGATRLSMMGRTVSLVEWRQATSLRNQLTIIIGGARLILGIAISIWALETYGSAHLIWTVVVSYVARWRLWCLMLRYLELLGLLLMAIQRAWILCLTIAWMYSSIIQGSWPLTFVCIYGDLVVSVYYILISHIHLLYFHALLHAYWRVVELEQVRQRLYYELTVEWMLRNGVVPEPEHL